MQTAALVCTLNHECSAGKLFACKGESRVQKMNYSDAHIKMEQKSLPSALIKNGFSWSIWPSVSSSFKYLSQCCHCSQNICHCHWCWQQLVTTVCVMDVVPRTVGQQLPLLLIQTSVYTLHWQHPQHCTMDLWSMVGWPHISRTTTTTSTDPDLSLRTAVTTGSIQSAALWTCYEWLDGHTLVGQQLPLLLLQTRVYTLQSLLAASTTLHYGFIMNGWIAIH